MTAPDPLPYESRTPGTLEPGEVLLWEGSPLPAKAPPSVRHVFIVSSIALVVLLSGGTLLAMAGMMPPAVLGMLLGTCGVGIAVWALRPRKRAGVMFRITDRRLLHIPRTGPATSVDVARFTGFAVTTKRNHTSCRFDAGEADVDVVVYERMPEPAALQRLIASLPARTNRRARLRRRPHPRTPDPSATMSAIVHQPAPPIAAAPNEDVALVAGEHVLWSGRPRPREPLDVTFLLGRLKILGWMLVPVGILLLHSGWFGIRLGHWTSTAIGAVWIIMALHALTLGPWLARRRRARTRYYLTNVRAIEVIAGRTRTARSVFLDMVHDLSLSERPDGCGDLMLLSGTFTFERIEDVRTLHRMAIDAVRAAGGEMPAGGEAA